MLNSKTSAVAFQSLRRRGVSLNYIDNRVVFGINDDDLNTRHKEQVGLNMRYFGGYIRGHRV